MAVLSQEKLASLNIDKIYNIETYVLNINLWKQLDKSLKIKLKNPKKYPFDENIRTLLPKKAKGIYIFTVEPEFPFIPTVVNFMYVGRVTAGNTFFKRFHEYVTAIGKEDQRRNIQILTNAWPGKTWVYVYELSLPDTEIKKIERNIFNSIVPPMNNEFTLKRAKNSRSLYN
jgi:hypothetical protein